MALLTRVSVDHMQQLNDGFAPGLDVLQQTLQTINRLVEAARALPTFIADARYTLNQHESLTLQLQQLMEQLHQQAQARAQLEVDLDKEAQARAQLEVELDKEAQARAHLEEELGKERQANTLLQEQLQKKNEDEVVYKQKIATLMQRNQAEAKKSKSEATKLQDEIRKLNDLLKARDEEDKLKREDMQGMLKTWDEHKAAREAPRTRAAAAAGRN